MHIYRRRHISQQETAVFVRHFSVVCKETRWMGRGLPRSLQGKPGELGEVPSRERVSSVNWIRHGPQIGRVVGKEVFLLVSLTPKHHPYRL